jgi:heptosyltransferase III
MTRLDLPARPRILIITLRRLGDVLLTTPLVRSIRRGFPDARVDILVFRGSDAILHGNPDIDKVLTMSERPSMGETLALVSSLFRRYDLVVCTQPGDRPTFFSLIGGRRRVGLVPAAGQRGAAWKRFAHHIAIVPEPNTHRVTQLKRLAEALGLDCTGEIVCPRDSSTASFPAKAPYAVLHANPFYQYKRWTDKGWRELAQGLAERGLTIIATEGPDAAERAYLDQVWADEVRSDEAWAARGVTVTRARLSWAELSTLLKGAAVYVGPDTSTTHLAAATGCPTIALYGPTSPRLIGPWPVGGLDPPWDQAGTIQRRGNVWVVQNPLPCLPCEKLGCEGHLESYSQCLDELSAGQVLAAVDDALSGRGAPNSAMPDDQRPAFLRWTKLETSKLS